MNKKNKPLFGSFSKSILAWYKNLNTQGKTAFWIFMGAVILSLCLSILFSTIRTYDSDLSIQECNQKVFVAVMDTLEMQEDNSILVFIYAFRYMFSFLIISIGVAWMLHGVGFHIIKR